MASGRAHSCREWVTSAPAAAERDGSDFLNRGHLGVRPLVHGRVRWGHGLLQFDALGCVPGLERGELSFQPLHYRHSVQTELVPALQHVDPAPVGSQMGVLQGERIKGSNGSMNALHCCCLTHALSHMNIIYGGTDNLRSA
jgi:hypothetical protein